MQSLLRQWRPRAVALWQASWTDRCLLVECVLLLALSRLAVLLLPFRWLAARLGGLNEESSQDDHPATLPQVEQMGVIIRRASRHTFWNSNCFAQALTAHVMLRRRRIGSTIYMGLRTDEQTSELKGHAWLRSGSRMITGTPQHQTYQCVATFAWDK